MRATEDASRGPFHVLERRHSLAKIVERGAVVPAERLSVHFPHLERESITIPENASRYGHRFAQQCLGFFEALQIHEGKRVVVGS